MRPRPNRPHHRFSVVPAAKAPAKVYDLSPSPAATLQAKIHFLERRERSLTVALQSHRLNPNKRQRIVEKIEAIGLAIVDAREVLARLQ